MVILISWQLEKFTCQAKVQILWVQLVKNKTSFFFIQLIYYSQYSRSFVSNPCEPAGKYLQLPSRNLKDPGPYLWYVQKQPPKRVLITSQWLLLSALELPPLNIYGEYKPLLLFCYIFYYLVCNGFYWWEFVSLKDSDSWTVATRNETDPKMFWLTNCAESLFVCFF